MGWSRVVSALLATSIFLYIVLQTLKFRRQFKHAINEERTLSKEFAEQWSKQFKKQFFLSVLAVIFGLIAIFLNV